MAENIADLVVWPNIDAGLSQVQLEEIAARLLDKRRELAERLADLERQMVSRDDCSLADAADAANLQENRLRARVMVDWHRQTLEEIDAALHRLANGRYGVSETTGEPIDYDRLMLVPWTRGNIGDDD